MTAAPVLCRGGPAAPVLLALALAVAVPLIALTINVLLLVAAFDVLLVVAAFLVLLFVSHLYLRKYLLLFGCRPIMAGRPPFYAWALLSGRNRRPCRE